ncbi:4-hydroxyphenylpyruvate dioxygenase [Corchorus olitorius]|uniref:4-hydroxyphenylpyruvate dioxygenase n=1 Tax=Corchorus olitorius TaxID=93759 RepID=A0A1R3FV86_9ROSI|nr:4-hydroxyphenylpyruvate dioxygenase [Corchorus olitorius]
MSYNLKAFTGFHEFAKFTTEDVGTSQSGLNSVVLANNDETVLVAICEPVFGMKKILKGNRIELFKSFVGNSITPGPVASSVENIATPNNEIKECEELGILVDRDDQGTLLQIFTKPVGDR